MPRGNQTQESQQSKDGISFKDGTNIACHLAIIHQSCITPLLRHSFGSNSPGGHGLLAMIAMLVYAAEMHSPAVMAYWWVWLMAVIVNRIRTRSLVRAGTAEHSAYAGWPWVAMLIPGVRKERQGKAMEPIMCLFAGTLIAGAGSPALGALIGFGFVSMMVVQIIERLIEERMVTGINDARRYGEWINELQRRRF